MCAGSSQMPTNDGDWFQPGTHSLWLYDREGRGKPALLAVYEWEMAGLRGVYIENVWGDLLELSDSKDDWDPDYTMLRGEVIAQEQLNPLEFAQLIATGHLHRIGSMPQIEGYIEPPFHGKESRTDPSSEPHDPADS